MAASLSFLRRCSLLFISSVRITGKKKRNRCKDIANQNKCIPVPSRSQSSSVLNRLLLCMPVKYSSPIKALISGRFVGLASLKR